MLSPENYTGMCPFFLPLTYISERMHGYVTEPLNNKHNYVIGFTV